MATEIIDIDAAIPIGLYIPVGVAHGFYSLTQMTLLYLVDNYYDGSDELGVAWNDPMLKVPWGVEEPVLSERDAKNPRFSEIASHLLPQA
jgi:dTDP-4-dehydrorhamnose 3,5-epimerase